MFSIICLVTAEWTRVLMISICIAKLMSVYRRNAHLTEGETDRQTETDRDRDRVVACIGAFNVHTDQPDPASIVSVECKRNIATVEWMPGAYNNAPLQYYIIQYNTSFVPDTWTFALKVSEVVCVASWLSVCLSVCLSARVCACLSVCVYVYVCV